LRRRNAEEEQKRQQRIDEQHAQMPEVDETPEQHHYHVEPTSTRNRASIGVRLPIAPQSEPAPRLPEPDAYDPSVPAEPQPSVVESSPRVQVLPQSLIAAAVPRRHSSTTDDDAAAWDETPEPTVFKTSAPSFPEEPNEPTPTPAYSANVQHQTPLYDYVPEPPTQPSTGHAPVQRDLYDYVPDEPPAIQAELVTNKYDTYEEPPMDVAPSSSSGGLTAVAVFDYEPNVSPRKICLSNERF
jgi:hypothetical protein